MQVRVSLKTVIPLFFLSYTLAFVPLFLAVSVYYAFYYWNPYFTTHLGGYINPFDYGPLNDYMPTLLDQSAFVILLLLPIAQLVILIVNNVRFYLMKEKPEPHTVLFQPLWFFKYSLMLQASYILIFSIFQVNYMAYGSLFFYLLVGDLLFEKAVLLSKQEGSLSDIFQRVQPLKILSIALLLTLFFSPLTILYRIILVFLIIVIILLSIPLGILILFPLRRYIKKEILWTPVRRRTFFNSLRIVIIYAILGVWQYYDEEWYNFSNFEWFDMPHSTFQNLFIYMGLIGLCLAVLTLIRVRKESGESPLQPDKKALLFWPLSLACALLLSGGISTYNQNQLSQWQTRVEQEVHAIKEFPPMTQLKSGVMQEGNGAPLYLNLLGASRQKNAELLVNTSDFKARRQYRRTAEGKRITEYTKVLTVPELQSKYDQPLQLLRLAGQYQQVKFPYSRKYHAHRWRSDHLIDLSKHLGETLCKEGQFKEGRAYLIDALKLNLALTFAMNMEVEQFVNRGIFKAFHHCITPEGTAELFEDIHQDILKSVDYMWQSESLKTLRNTRLLYAQYFMLNRYFDSNIQSKSKYHSNLVQNTLFQLYRSFYAARVLYYLKLSEDVIQSVQSGLYGFVNLDKMSYVSDIDRELSPYRIYSSARTIEILLTRMALETYHREHQRYPTQLNELKFTLPERFQFKKKLVYQLEKQGYYLSTQKKPTSKWGLKRLSVGGFYGGAEPNFEK